VPELFRQHRQAVVAFGADASKSHESSHSHIRSSYRRASERVAWPGQRTRETGLWNGDISGYKFCSLSLFRLDSYTKLAFEGEDQGSKSGADDGEAG